MANNKLSQEQQEALKRRDFLQACYDIQVALFYSLLFDGVIIPDFKGGDEDAM